MPKENATSDDNHRQVVHRWDRLGGGSEGGAGGGRGSPLTIRLRVVRPRLGVRVGGLAWELLLEVPAETGREAVGRRIPKASRHAH